MSRPTAMQRAQASAEHMRSVSTYAEICMVQESLEGVVLRECSRFGEGSDIYAALTTISVHLESARQNAEARTRQQS